MNSSSEWNGYGYEYTIDLDDSSFANVCFNDGHNNWDSNNANNYKFEAGVYQYSNGKINKIY